MSREILIKLDELRDGIHKLDITAAAHTVILEKQEENLRTHMKRTDLLESAVKKLDDDIKPIQGHVDRVNGAVKMVCWIGAIVGGAVTLIAAVLKVVF